MCALQAVILLLAFIKPLVAQTTEEIAAKAEAYISTSGFRGSILLAKDGKIILAKGYGLANIELDVANSGIRTQH